MDDPLIQRGVSPQTHYSNDNESNEESQNSPQPQLLHHIDVAYFETQVSFQDAQDEVKKLSLQKESTQQKLEEKMLSLQQAQMEYDIALLQNNNAAKALDEAHDKMLAIDLQMPGERGEMLCFVETLCTLKIF